MKYMIWLIALVFIPLLAAGCPSPADRAAPKQSAVAPQETTAAESLDKAKAATKEAAQAMQDYTYAQKNEFIAKMKKELTEIEQMLDRVALKIQETSGEARAAAQTKLDAARVKWTEVKNQLDRAESATESTWDDIKNQFKKAYEQLKESSDKTRQWLSEKIAP